ncbi:MAG: hypothetical protein ABH821_01365 [archaeon]
MNVNKLNLMALALMVLVFTGLTLAVQAVNVETSTTTGTAKINDTAAAPSLKEIMPNDSLIISPTQPSYAGSGTTNTEVPTPQSISVSVAEVPVQGISSSGGVTSVTVSSEQADEVSISDSRASAISSKSIEVSEDRVFIRSTDTEQAIKYELKVMPGVALETAKVKLGYQAKKVEAGLQSEPSLEADIEQETPVYKARMMKKFNLFGFIPLDAEVSTTVNAETGMTSDIAMPWWAIFATK